MSMIAGRGWLLLGVILLSAWRPAPCGWAVAASSEAEPGPARSLVVLADRSNPTLAYAADELCKFLKEVTNLQIHQPDRADGPGAEGQWVFELAIDPAVEPGAFSVLGGRPSEGTVRVKLAGQDSTAVLHAVYTMLEELGICFDITGPILPDRLELERLIGRSCLIRPDVRLRGVRQYINFPMDLSSYSLSEAKEYIRNVARLRMNWFAVHSYRSLFYACPDLNLLAGQFFYGWRHDLPDEPWLRNVMRNRRTFCIPEIEAVYDQPELKSEAALWWLNEVLQQARTCGLTVQFSFEPPGKTAEEGLAAARAILVSYPQIQVLEMITPENAGRAEETLARYLNIAQRLQGELSARCPRLAVGVYETGAGLRAGVDRLRERCPPDIGWTFLPAHGARNVVEAVRAAEFSQADWRRSMIYSWAEFDGLMFLQQNALIGTRQLLDLARSTLGEETVPAIAFLHWRTAENRTALRYAALACLDAALTPERFYQTYAASLGLGQPETYARAMNELDDLDVFCRDHLFNIGFCWVSYWANRRGVNRLRGWKPEDLREGARRFQAVRQSLAECLPETQTHEGRRYLRFLDNRLNCSSIHLEAIGQLTPLCGICDDQHPEALNAAERQTVKQQCDAALALVDRYMRLHAEATVDRGCEGNLVSYYHSLPAYVATLRQAFLDSSAPKQVAPGTGSGPPAPGRKAVP